MIEFKGITKTYNGVKAVENVNLTINDGEFVCFIGTSGSGKTTTMRMINRMVKPTSGSIEINGKNIQDMNEVNLRRQIGYVIQQVGLMPHMTIYENIVLVPKLLKWPEDKMKASAQALIERVDLSPEIMDQYPNELSGGMQQRIGVIRALAANQNIILMDEPFGALDPITRDALQRLVKKLQMEMNKTIVFVTHDMDEALNLADKIVVMDKGNIVQIGSPKEILMEPANEFVKELIGEERLNQAIFEYDTVVNIMREPIKIQADSSIGKAAALMSKTRVDDVLVVDNNNVLVGRIDLRAIISRKNENEKVSSLLKKVTYVKSDTTIRDVIYYIQELGYRNVSVVDDDRKLVGIVTRGDIVSSVYDAFWSDYHPVEDNADDLFDDYPNVATPTDKTTSKEGDES